MNSVIATVSERRTVRAASTIPVIITAPRTTSKRWSFCWCHFYGLYRVSRCDAGHLSVAGAAYPCEVGAAVYGQKYKRDGLECGIGCDDMSAWKILERLKYSQWLLKF